MRPIARDGVPVEVDRARMAARYAAVREATEALAAPLSAEDQTLQSMPDASPTKWHLAHTTWFFETFLLSALARLPRLSRRFGYLFNSYYEAVGPRHPRPAARPAVAAGRRRDRSPTAPMSTRRWRG